jgi:DNA topoisomerase-1
MPKNLVIVESPAKAKTIEKFLGKDYQVRASMGHMKDLPKSKLGVDVEKNFEPHYITIRARSKLLGELKSLAKKSKHVFLATDPDREGEAIGWHLYPELKTEKNEVSRILFNEITKKAIQAAVAQPRPIDLKLVNAQQARRILDRLFGYGLSPLLWKNVRRGLSAGRVQSVAVRLIVEREQEIQAFVPREYWELEIELGAAKGAFKARLASLEGQKVEDLQGARAQALGAELPGLAYRVAELTRKEVRRNPVPPFITSKLQQEAARKLHFSAKKTMMVAQQLYEGIELGDQGAVGLITYMRTDSVRVAAEAQQEAREFVEKRWGRDHLPEKAPHYKSKGGAQDAHEAIRPTSVFREPRELSAHLNQDQSRLYRLIWQKFLASQMAPALFDATSVDVSADKQGQAGYAGFKASGSVLKFAGFLAAWEIPVKAGKSDGSDGSDESDREDGDKRLPELTQGEALKFLGGAPSQHFTQPPPRYDDASLIRALEENNIGRPSTYAPTVSTVLDRGYVERIEGGKLKPSELGVLITGLLVKHFERVINVEFTARLEQELDRVEEGAEEWQEAVAGFYAPFKQDLDEAAGTMRNLKKEVEVTTDIVCEKCGGKMAVKWGRFGKFLACSNYPACKNSRPLEDGPAGGAPKPVEALDEKCPTCGKPLTYKQGRFGRFIACSGYPECKYTRAITQSIGVACPKCGGQVVVKRSRRGRSFYGCGNYPKCDFVSWDKPVARACPKGDSPYLVEKFSKRDGAWVACPKCDYKESVEKAPAATP